MSIIQQIAWTLVSDAVDLVIVGACFYFLWMLRDVAVALWKRRSKPLWKWRRGKPLSPYRLVRDEKHEW